MNVVGFSEKYQEKIWEEYVENKKADTLEAFGNLTIWEETGNHCVNCGARLNDQFRYIIAKDIWKGKKCGADNLAPKRMYEEE